MMSPNRWLVEQEIIRESFPQLQPFRCGEKIGFQGWLRLDTTRSYQMVVEASLSGYPQEQPRVYMSPHPEEHHWIRSGGQPYLCFERTSVWSPARSTFASCVAIAVRYLKEFSR